LEAGICVRDTELRCKKTGEEFRCFANGQGGMISASAGATTGGNYDQLFSGCLFAAVTGTVVLIFEEKGLPLFFGTAAAGAGCHAFR
jgi:hypothetical protein